MSCLIPKGKKPGLGWEISSLASLTRLKYGLYWLTKRNTYIFYIRRIPIISTSAMKINSEMIAFREREKQLCAFGWSMDRERLLSASFFLFFFLFSLCSIFFYNPIESVLWENDLCLPISMLFLELQAPWMIFFCVNWVVLEECGLPVCYICILVLW